MSCLVPGEEEVAACLALLTMEGEEEVVHCQRRLFRGWWGEWGEEERRDFLACLCSSHPEVQEELRQRGVL